MNDVDTPRWKHNQMVEALWFYTVTAVHWGSDPHHLIGKVPKVFRSRIKKMLNMDRIPGMTPWKGLDGMWAFYDGSSQGAGSEELFSTFHVFIMSLAIELLNVGLKQSEVIFFLKHKRPTLREAFAYIHNEKKGVAPFSGASRDMSANDRTVWMVVRREEVQEQYPLLPKKIGDNKMPLFMEPEFFDGFDGLREHLVTHTNFYRHVILIELADPALTLHGCLEKTPAVRRGRPSTRKR